MAIKDWDGSAWHEIGKVYDYNGSVWSQIGKVYDNNGTANSLIYTSEYNIMTGSNNYTGGWIMCSGPYVQWGSMTNYGSSLAVGTYAGQHGNNNGACDIRSGSTIGLSGFSTLHFTISSYSGGFYKSRLGVSTVAQNGTSALGNSDAFLDNSAVYKTQRNVFFTGNGAYTMNISDLSGGYYIFIGGVNSTYGSSKSFVISNIYLT